MAKRVADNPPEVKKSLRATPSHTRSKTSLFLIVASLALGALLWAVARKLWLRTTLDGNAGRVDLHAGLNSLSRPNVLLISLDTLRPDHLGCYGYKANTSPNLDLFAATAIRFDRAYSQIPLTCPSHVSVLTSTLPSRSGANNVYTRVPVDLPTLPQLLRENGYFTAAIVNNAQMSSAWGFDRGFDFWREYQVDTAGANCEGITTAAMGWLSSHGSEAGAPFFLFLHYYDPHDPYVSPPGYRDAFGVRLQTPELHRLIYEHQYQNQPLDPQDLGQLVAAYDAAIAWTDHELGRLLRAVPPNTMVVIFSDHGESFKEHGYLRHGQTVHEEAVHAVLLIRPAAGDPPQPQPQTNISDPVMLMDIAPTILAACGIQPPTQYQGSVLCPAWRGGTPTRRAILSEAWPVCAGRVSRSLTFLPWKLIYYVGEREFELYKLPDEQHDLSAHHAAVADGLLHPMEAWTAEQDYWVLYARGPWRFDVTLQCPDGLIPVAAALNYERGRDRQDCENRETFTWTCFPGQRVKKLLVQLSNPASALRIDAKIDGVSQPTKVFLGPGMDHPPGLPAEVPPLPNPFPSSPMQPYDPALDGLHLIRYSGNARGRTDTPKGLDVPSIEQLKGLGYME